MNLTKLKKIGFFVSLIWILEAGFHERDNQIDEAQKILNAAQQNCMASGNHTAMTCLKQRNKNAETLLRPDWVRIVSAGIVPLIIFWYLFSVCIKAYRSFRDEQHSNRYK